MPDLGPRRSQGIYSAVHERLMDLRIAVKRELRERGASEHDQDRLDDLLYHAQAEAAAAAVRAAAHDYRKTRRTR